MPSYDTELDEDDVTCLDPSVAALLEPCDDPSQLRIRIAMMKLQQARVRGNSDYAAKIMDHAIEEGARDRQTWTLLEKHIAKLEEQVSVVSAVPPTKEETSKEDDKEGKVNEEKETSTDETVIKDEEQKVSSDEINKLKEEVSAEKERSKAMEALLVECLVEELGSVRAEQSSLHEREARLKARIRSLRLTIPKLSVESAKELQESLTEIQENQCTLLNAMCSVCMEQSATKAVIPCGHLCLCDACTASITKSDTAARRCPLCRGQLLSTLHIYTSK